MTTSKYAEAAHEYIIGNEKPARDKNEVLDRQRRLKMHCHCTDVLGFCNLQMFSSFVDISDGSNMLAEQDARNIDSSTIRIARSAQKCGPEVPLSSCAITSTKVLIVNGGIVCIAGISLLILPVGPFCGHCASAQCHGSSGLSGPVPRHVWLDESFNKVNAQC